MTSPKTYAAVAAELDAAAARAQRHYKALEDHKARLATTLDLLARANAANELLANELRQAHREIASLENQRDTWRAKSGT